MGLRSFKKRRVALLCDLASPIGKDQEFFLSHRGDVNWKSEFDIYDALIELGHDPFFIGVFNKIDSILDAVKNEVPDIVFNLAESFDHDRSKEPQLVALLELLKIPYTGTSSLGLSICQDKSLAKKILSHHHIKVPRWISSLRRSPLKTLENFTYPAFVKATATESSEGISKDSLVNNEKDCMERVRYLHEKFDSDVMVEQFIEGREIYVSLLGHKKINVFPLREITYSKEEAGESLFATYKVKWDEDYRKRHGIKNQFARTLSSETEINMDRIARRCFQVLQLCGPVRLDLRLTESGEVFVLEANPNPSLSKEEDYAQSALKSGLSYPELIQKILDLGFAASR